MDTKDLEIKKLKKDISISTIKQSAFIVLFIAEIIFLAAIFINFFDLKNPFSTDLSKDKIALLHIDEPITTSYVEHLIKSIEKIKDNKHYKAILMDISSPGGSPTASQEFTQYIKDLNKTLPVTIYVNSMAASGAYYIASAIKPLYANKNAIVGSIGVIMPHYSANKLAQKIGIKEETVTAGKFKQPFSIFKEMTPQNKEYIENSLLKPVYKNFVEDVANNRGIKVDKLKEFAQGKVFVANMPEIKGILVDKITNLYKLKENLKDKFPNAKIVTIAQKTKPKDLFNILFNKKLLSVINGSFEMK